MNWIMETFDWIKGVVADNFSALIGLLGVYVGVWLTRRQMEVHRKLEFCEKQLREFYSPLVGIRKEIRILSEFRLAGEKAHYKWWQDVSKFSDQIKERSLSQKYLDEKGSMISSQIEYENKQLTEKIIPAYRQMAAIFKNNYWLAEEETKNHFPTLIQFIETWERHLSRTHPPEVIQEISVSEEKLMPFYANIEQFHNFLREKLKEGKPPKSKSDAAPGTNNIYRAADVLRN